MGGETAGNSFLLFTAVLHLSCTSSCGFGGRGPHTSRSHIRPPSPLHGQFVLSRAIQTSYFSDTTETTVISTECLQPTQKNIFSSAWQFEEPHHDRHARRLGHSPLTTFLHLSLRYQRLRRRRVAGSLSARWRRSPSSGTLAYAARLRTDRCPDSFITTGDSRLPDRAGAMPYPPDFRRIRRPPRYSVFSACSSR